MSAYLNFPNAILVKFDPYLLKKNESAIFSKNLDFCSYVSRVIRMKLLLALIKFDISTSVCHLVEAK